MEIAHKVKPFISFHGKLFYLKKVSIFANVGTFVHIINNLNFKAE